eukprot:Em0004g1133a
MQAFLYQTSVKELSAHEGIYKPGTSCLVSRQSGHLSVGALSVYVPGMKYTLFGLAQHEPPYVLSFHHVQLNDKVTTEYRDIVAQSFQLVHTGKEPCVMEEEVADLMDAHTPSVSSVRQASQSLITSHIKPSRFTHSSVSPVQQASSITSPVKPSSFTRSSVSPVWQGSSITSPVKPSSFIRSSVSPVRQASHSPSVTSPVKPSTFTRSSVSPIRNSHLPLNLYLQKELIRHKSLRNGFEPQVVMRVLQKTGLQFFPKHQTSPPLMAKIAKDSWSKELLSLLEDEPYRMVTHHGLAQTGDYDAVCDCIQRSYAPLGSELEWQLKVRTRVQKVGESLMEFCGALRALMKEEPKTLDDALKLACKHEMVETAQKHLQMLRQKEVVASTEEPNVAFMERHGLMVARSVSFVSKGSKEVLVQLLNPSSFPIVLHKQEVVGTLHSLDEHNSMACSAGVDTQGSHNTSVQSIAKQLVDKVAEGVTDNEKDELQQLLLKYNGILSQYEGDLGRTDLVYHHIVTGDHKGIKQSGRKLPFHQREEVKELLDGMLERQVIETSQGSWSSPVVLVKKKDGSTRFCVDFRQLNAVTKKDAQPLPRIDKTLDVLGSARWFSCLDLTSGYWQVEVAPEDCEKTAFVTPYGLFQFRVMPFGLTNAPATFQRLMERVLAGLHWTTCLIYLDDILIFSATVQQHFTRLREIFDRLKQAGHVVSEHGIKTDSDKTRCIADWPTPSCLQDLKQFLGLASYYRRFVRNFAALVAPLVKLTEKGHVWHWSSDCDAAFLQLKERLVTSPILGYPVFNQPFMVDTDASGEGLGAVLSQYVSGVEHVIAFASRSLSKAERKYCATRREMLALVWAIKHFRPYLYGRRFTVRTDHASLRWLQSFHEPEGQVARWLECLSEYDFEVVHRPGTKHTNADALSRMPCPQCQLSFPQVCTMQSDIWLPCWTLDELAEEQRQDSSIGQVIQWMENDSIPRVFPKHLSSHTQALWAQSSYLVLQNGVLYRRWEDVPCKGLHRRLQLVLPPTLVPVLLEALHSSIRGGHFGTSKTLAKLDPAVRPLQRVAMDIMGPLPETSRGNKYILVIADYFTKWSEAYPIPNMEAITVAKCLVNEFICRFGVPEQLHSDQGRNFEISTEQVLRGEVEYVDYLKKRFQLVHQYVRQNAQKGMQCQKTGYDQKENTRKVSQISSTMARTASPHGEQEPNEEEEEKGTPSEEQESRGEEINKEPQESMADLQDEQYIYVETRRPEPGPAVEEHVPPPPLIAPAPRQPPQPPAEPELPQPGEQLRRSTRNRHPPHWYGHIVVHSAHTHTNCEDTVSLDGELCNDGNSCTHEQHY